MFLSPWGWAQAHRASSLEDPGGPVAVVTGSGHQAEAVALLMAHGRCRKEPFGGSGYEVGEHSVLGSQRRLRSAFLPRQHVLSVPAAKACCPLTSGHPVCELSDESKHRTSTVGQGARHGST